VDLIGNLTELINKNLPIRDPVAVFALLAVILLFVPLLFKKFRIPAMVGLILTGVIIGPKGFNLLGFESGMQLLSTVGLLYIMFIAGLEIDLNQFLNQRAKAIVFGLLIFGIAMAGGIGIGFLIPHPPKADPIIFCILMGALMSSQTLLTYPLVSRLGLSKDISVTISIGATLLTDMLALTVLAVVAKIHGGEAQAFYWIRLVAGFICLGAVSIYLLPRAGRWFYKNMSRDDTAEYLFLFFSLLLLSSISKLSGLEPIIGAFLAGLSLNPLVPDQSRLMNRVQFVGHTLFIPVFLISVGMLVDYKIFMTGTSEWIVISLMMAVSIGAKFAASFLSGLFFKFKRDQSWLMFGMVVNKAGVALATSIVGFNIGIFGQDVLNGAIIIILVTCLIGPWVTENYGRRYALSLSTTPGGKNFSNKNQKILVPLSNPTTSRHLMEIAFMIRDKKAGNPIYPVSIAIDGPGVKEDVMRIEKMLSQTIIHAAATDIPVHPETRIDTDIATCVSRTAVEIQATCIIIGWKGDILLPKLIFGQVLDRLLEQTSELVMVCKIEQPVNTFQKIIVVIPPMSQRQSGFEEAILTTKTLSLQSGLKTTVFASSFDMPKTSELFEPAKTSSSITLTTVETWSDIFNIIGQTVGDNDLVVLLSCRQGSLAWQPGLDQLPRYFIKNFPKTSLIVGYPSEARTVYGRFPEGDSSVLSSPIRKLMSQERIVFGMENERSEEAVEKMLVNFLKGRVSRPESTASILSTELLPTVLEIIEGTVLLHVHCESTEEPTVLLGTSNTGIAFDGIADPAKSIFILLSPASDNPENHLQTLSDIARFALSMKNSDILHKAKNLPELESALKKL